MGLDNAICIKRNKYSENITALKKYEESWDKEHKYDFTVCYWRKCWNVRNDILSLLSDSYNGMGGSIDITLEELKKIRCVLKSYNRHSWNYSSQSIWTWEEHKKINRRHIKNIKELIKLKKKYPNLEIYFVDSY